MESHLSRQQNLKAMAEEEFDLVIIGGGITGAGVARDAASRGMRVALVEAADFASGTSSRSTKLIHGGIRYLENFEFGLVFEALSERQKLFEMAPHLVHPLRFLIPIYKGGRVPAWKMGLGMWAYDALSLFEAPELHEHLSPGEVKEEVPSLREVGLQGGFTYYDAYMDDDRLVIETLRSAQALGAKIANYVRVDGVQRTDGQISALECHDLESKQNFSIRAKHFVSSVGPWTDRLGGGIFANWKKKLRPSKGVHLTFLRERFPLKDAVVMAAEKRIVFAIPRHEMVIVGTTDTDFPQDPGLVKTETSDVEYILNIISDYFPGFGITTSDIVGCYAGVRPLIDDGSQTESKTSREHEIWTVPERMTFVAGGKYTTYRNMACQTVDEALRWFPIETQVRFAKSETDRPLNPLVTEENLARAKRESADWASAIGADPKDVALLAFRHGLETTLMLRQAMQSLKISPQAREWLWCVEALHAVEKTMCLHLSDFYFRRTPLVLSRPDHGLSAVESVSRVMGELLQWSESERQREINALQKQINWELSATQL